MLQIVLAVTGASLLAADFLLFALTGREGMGMGIVGFAAVAMGLLFLAYDID